MELWKEFVWDFPLILLCVPLCALWLNEKEPPRRQGREGGGGTAENAEFIAEIAEGDQARNHNSQISNPKYIPIIQLSKLQTGVGTGLGH